MSSSIASISELMVAPPNFFAGHAAESGSGGPFASHASSANLRSKMSVGLLMC